MKASQIANEKIVGAIGRLLAHEFSVTVGYKIDRWVEKWTKERDQIIKKFIEIKDDETKVAELNDMIVELEPLDFNLISEVKLSFEDRQFLKPLLANLPE